MGARVSEVLKRDALGRVELLEEGAARRVRRLAVGGRVPGSGPLARALLRRERRALERLEGLEGVPALEADPRWLTAGQEGAAPGAGRVLVRSFVEGRALHEAEVLALDFFERLEELVGRMHARGVCHNDLHKEQNVVVGDDGWPALVDFQLASVHPSGGRAFRVRCGDDLRHVAKHRRRYTRDGRGPDAEPQPGRMEAPPALPPRSLAAGLWRKLVKPVYNLVTRGLGLADGEPRRPSSGPWPRWSGPLLPRGGGR